MDWLSFWLKESLGMTVRNFPTAAVIAMKKAVNMVTSAFYLLPSAFWLLTFDFWLLTFDFWLLTSDSWLLTSDFWHNWFLLHWKRREWNNDEIRYSVSPTQHIMIYVVLSNQDNIVSWCFLYLVFLAPCNEPQIIALFPIHSSLRIPIFWILLNSYNQLFVF